MTRRIPCRFLQVGDVPDLARANQVSDLLGQAGLVHLVRELGHDDALPPLWGFLDLGDGPDLDRSATGGVGIDDALLAEDGGPRREVGPLDELHQVLWLAVGVVQVVDDPVDHFPKVVRRDVGGHPHRDAARPVHQEVREPRREHRGLLLVPVVVGDEVDGLSLDVAEHLHGDLRQPGLGVTHGPGRIAVHRPEVPMGVHQRIPKREILGHPDHRLVHRVRAVRVVLLHHLADRGGRLAIGAVGP